MEPTNENLCKECKKFLPVLNGKCEACLSGPELEALADLYYNKDNELAHFSFGVPVHGC